MSSADPDFPPLLDGRQTTGPREPFAEAVAGAGDGTMSAGSLIWSFEGSQMRLAIVLEPEVDRTRCHEMVFLLMVAFGDAFGALSPPEVKITHDWPNGILANDGEIGHVGIAISDQNLGGTPLWMVIGLTIRLAPLSTDPEPGHVLDKTTLWEEGCGGINATELLEATARHFLVWVHNWEEDGFRSVHQTWSERMAARTSLTKEYEGRRVTGEPLGLDEHGALLIRSGQNTQSLHIAEMLGPSP